MDGGDVAVAPPNKNEVGAVVTELIPNIDTSYESKRQSSEISDPISVDLEHADSQEDLRMANSPITEPVRASPPPSLLPTRSRVASESLYLLDHNMPSHFPMLMNHYHPVQVLMPPMGPVQTEAIPTDGRSINDMDNSHHRSGSSPTNNLSALIQHQMEYYFSRDNLQNDSYLLSQMDEDQFVAIQTVAGFNQIKKLTTDIKVIVEAIKNSPCLQIDDTGTKVRANVIRSVIILREIPETTSIEDVKNLFNSNRCPKFVSCEFAHNDSWYVSFDTETEAREAYRYLREEVREFLGKPIYARIKGKTLQRNTYNKGSKPTTPHSQPQQQSIFSFPAPLQPAPIMLYPTFPPWPPQPQPFFDHPNVPYMVNGYPPGAGGYHHHHHAGHLANFNRSSISGNHRNRGAGGRSYSQGDQPTAPVMQQQQQHNSHNNNNSSNSHSTQTLPPRYNRARDNNDDSSRKGLRMRNSRRRDDYSDKPLRQQNKHSPKIDLVEPSQFPPLVSQPTSNGTSQSSQQGNASEDGYAQAASVKGKKITPLSSTTTTTTTTTTSSTMATATTPVSNDKLTTSKLTSTTATVTTTTTTQLPASSNSAAEVESAPVPTPPPATPPKSTQKVVPTTAAKISKQEPSKPAAAKPSRADKDAGSRNSMKTKLSDNSKSSHHNSKASRRDKKKLESKASHQQPVKGSPQVDKKQIIPLPPSPPTTASNMFDKVDLKDVSKPEKLSYAVVAKSKPGETSQPGSPPAETSNEVASQPCSPDKSKDTVPI